MRKTLRVAKREYTTSVRTKGFIIALLLMPVMMGGSGLAMWLFQGQVDTRDKNVVILDRSGLVADVIQRAAEARNAAEVGSQDRAEPGGDGFLPEGKGALDSILGGD